MDGWRGKDGKIDEWMNGLIDLLIKTDRQMDRGMAKWLIEPTDG